MAGTLAPLALVLSPTSDTGIPLDGLTRRNGVDVAIVGLNLLGGPITIFDDRDGNGIPGPGEILTTVPNSILGAVRVTLPEGTHNLRATQDTTITVLGLSTTTTATSLPLPVRIDNTAPTIVSVNQLDLPDPLGLLDLVGVLRYEVTFSEPVIGLTADLFQATGTLPGTHLVTLLPSLTTPNTYIVSIGLGLDGVSVDQRAGTLGLALNPSNLSGVTDLAGNGLGNGAGGADFALLAPVSIGPARATATADFNADGLGDAAFLVNNTVVVTRGTGTGSLGTTQTVTVAAGQTTIATGDVTGDGLVDIVTAGNNTVQILKQGTDGTFALTSRATAGADGALIADVNGDGYADIVVKNLTNGTATVLTNTGTGTFSAGTAQAFTIRPDALVSGDFNGDGRIDLAALANGGTTLSVLTQAANGTFVRSTVAVDASAGGLAAGDLNGDGRAEIVSAGTAGTLDIRGTTAGGAVTQTTLQTGTAATEIRIGDTNGDGHADILYAGTDGNVRVVYGDGAGGFSTPVILETQAGLTALALLDIDGDGRQDLALASGTTGTLQVGTGIPLARVLGTAYDIVAPAPVQTVTALSVAGDNIVNIAEAAAGTVPVTGSLAGPLGTGETLAVRIGGTVTPLAGAVVATVDGVTTFSATIPALQASGDVAVLVQRTDGAASAALTQAVTVDLVAPTLVSVTSPDGAVTKDAVIDFTLAFSEPVTGLTAANLGLTGTAAAGLVPTVVTTDGGRTYMVTVPAATAEGTLGLTFDPAGIVDAAGNVVGGAGAAIPVGPVLTLDHTAPVLSLQPIAGDGILAQADLANGVVLAGTATGLEAGASVMVTITNATGTPVLTTTAPVTNGAFSLPLTASVGTVLTDGSYVVAVAAMDTAGNVAVPALANLTVDLTTDAGIPFGITAGNGQPIGLAGVSAVPLAVTGLDAGATAVVTFTDAGNHTVIATIGANGTSTVDLHTLSGSVTAAVLLTDAVGNNAALPGPTLTVDTVAPAGVAVPSAVQSAGTVSFDVSFPEAVTHLDAGDFQVVGTGAILGSVVQAVPNQAGGYTVVVGNLSGSGTLGLALSATSDIADAAGNAATLVASVPVALDLVAPAMPIITGLVSDGGVAGGFLTADTTPTVVGTAEAGSTVTVSFEGPAGTTGILTALAAPSGAWAVTVPSALADGAYTFTATTVDLSGNVSLPAASKVVTIETNTAIPFTLDVDFADGLVNRAEAAGVAYTLTGLPANAGLSVTFTDAGGHVASAVLTDQGGSLDLSGLDGPVTSALTYVPPAGPTVILGGPGATFDTVLPSAPVVLGFATAGALAATVTNDATPILIGTGEAGSTVTVEVGGQSLSAEVDANGTWRIPVTTALTAGTVTLTATAQDAAGNPSDVLPGLAVTIDLTADADAPITVGLALPAGGILNAGEAAAVTGTVAGIDADATATLAFTGQGGTVTVPLGNGPLAPIDLSALGGTVTASVSVTDAVGNHAILPVGSFTIDAVAPAATIVADPAAAPEATSFTFTVTFPEAVANLTVDDFALTGAGTAAGTVAAVTPVGGSYVVTVTGVTGTGSLSLGLASGSDIADAAGNLAVVAEAGLHLVNVAVVIQPADQPVITDITEDTGVAGDFVTRDAEPVVSGTALAGGTVTLTYTGPSGIPASLVTTADGTGHWSVTLPSLGDGTYNLSATLTDSANNVLGVSANHPLVIDTLADTGAPVALLVSGTADGVVNAAEATAVFYTVTGLDADSTAIVHFAAGASVKDVPVAADGTFTVDLSGFDGAVTTSVVVNDLAGNTATVPGNPIRVATAPTAQPVVDAVQNDTGLPGDGITGDTNPVLSGTAEAGSTVTVMVNGPNGVQTLQTIATDGGAWTLPVLALADGAYTVTASATGLSGLPSAASAPFALTIDTSADAAPLVGMQLASADTHLNANEASAVSFVLTGLDTGSSGTVVFTDGLTTVSVSVGANGSYTADLSSLSGPITAKAFLADVAGNTVAADLALPAGLTVDTLAPLGSAVADLSGGPAVASFTYSVDFPEAVTNVTADDFALTGTAGVSGQITSVTGAAGHYVVTVAGIQGSGTLSLGLSANSDIADLAGNTASLTVGTRDVVGIAPVQPVILGYTTDTGLQGDGVTSDASPSLTGIGQAGATVTVEYVTADGHQTVSAIVAQNGTWSLDIPTLTDGTYSFTASLTATDGSPIGTSQPLVLTLDLTAPGAPVFDALAPTTDTTPTLTGTAEAGAVVTLSDNGTVLGTALADADGHFSFTPTALLAAGDNVLTASATDAAGNVGAGSAPVTLVIGTTPPTGDTTAPDAPVIDAHAPTNDTTPVITGTAEAGATVILSNGTTQIGSTTADADGHFSLTPAALPEGTASLTAVAVDAAGNASPASAPTTVVIDLTAPNAPVFDALAPTADTTPTLTGTAEAGAVVTVSDNGTVLGTALVDADGHFSFTPTAPLAAGDNVLTASATDAAGNVGAGSTPVTLVIGTTPATGDTTAPDTPVIDAHAPTNDTTPVITGTAEAGATVILSNGTIQIGSTLADADGHFSLTPAALPEGTASLTAVAVDAAGNASPASAPTTVVIDLTAPGAPVFDALAPTADTTPTLTGTAEAGAVVTLSDNGTVLGTALADADGHFSFTPTAPLAAGDNVLTASATDAAGNVGAGSAPVTLVIGTTPGGGTAQPTPTIITGFSDDTGIVGDGITADTTPILSGVAAAGGTVTVTYLEAGTSKSATGAVDASGHWTLAIPTLSDGTYQFTATAADAGGTFSGTSAALTVTVDTVADVVPVVTLTVDGPTGGSLTPAQAAAVTFVVAGLDPGSVAAVTFTDGTHTVRVEAGADGPHQADLSGLTGTVTSSFVVSDAAGNSAGGSGNGFVIAPDGSPPQDPATIASPVVVGLQNDTGVPGDGITNDPSPTLTGTGTPGSSVTVTYGDPSGSHSVTGTVGSDGAWTIDLPTLPDGTYDLIATGRDAAGSTTTVGQPFRVVIDTVADAGTPVFLSVEPTGDGVVNAAEALGTVYHVSGLDAGSVAAVTFTDGTHSVTTQVVGDGRYAVDLTSLHGPVTSAVLATDAAGNGTQAAGNTVSLDTVGPAAPVVTGFSEDTGIVGNATTADTTPTLLGTAEAGSIVSIAYDTQHGPRTATVVAGADGHWTLDLPTLPEGGYTFVASATDAAGNRGPASAAFGLTIDLHDIVAGGEGTGGGNPGAGGTVGDGTGGNGTGPGGNLAPNAVSDTAATVTHAAAVTGNVLANDSDPNGGDVLHVTGIRFADGITVSVPQEGTATVVGDHGTLHMAADGSYSYQAIGSSNLTIGLHSSEGFTYTVSDGKGLSASAGLAVSVDGVAPAAEASFGFAFVDARVELSGETLVLTGPDGVHHDVGGIGTLHFTDGSIQENDGSPLVDDVWYLSHNLDVWKAQIDADTHYAVFGWHEGRDPNAYFSTDGYLRANPDVAAAGVNPLEHYTTYGEHEGRSPGQHFSPDAYLSANPDVAAAGINALEHYLQFGQGEGRTVQEGEGPEGNVGAFDPAFYLTQNPDVAAVAAQAAPLGLAPSDFAFRHYLEYGANEGRAPNALFDPGAYLSANPDVAAAGGNPLLHYQEYGWREGRNPSSGFDTDAYLEHNPDVAAAGIDPLQHYLDFGMKEGRLPA